MSNLNLCSVKSALAFIKNNGNFFFSSTAAILRKEVHKIRNTPYITIFKSQETNTSGISAISKNKKYRYRNS